jgi:tetratricopeptide (TPR) repeat protein
MKQKSWRDLVSRFKQKPAQVEPRPEDFFKIYKCRECSGELVHTGVESQSQCPHCGRYALELQTQLMEDIGRRARSMLEVAEALEQFKQGNFARAIKKLKEAIEIDPENNEAHYNLGEIYLQQENFEEGIAATRRAIELNDKDVMAHVNLATGLINQGKKEEAIREFDRAIELDPNNALARFNRGLTHLQAMRIDEAREDWQKYLELEPHSDRANMVRDFFERFGR